MRRAALLAVAWAAVALGCPETVRCPDGEIFDAAGACIPIPDAGPPASDGGPSRGDAGSPDGG